MVLLFFESDHGITTMGISPKTSKRCKIRSYISCRTSITRSSSSRKLFQKWRNWRHGDGGTLGLKDGEDSNKDD